MDPSIRQIQSIGVVEHRKEDAGFFFGAQSSQHYNCICKSPLGIVVAAQSLQQSTNSAWVGQDPQLSPTCEAQQRISIIQQVVMRRTKRPALHLDDRHWMTNAARPICWGFPGPQLRVLLRPARIFRTVVPPTSLREPRTSGSNVAQIANRPQFSLKVYNNQNLQFMSSISKSSTYEVCGRKSHQLPVEQGRIVTIHGHLSWSLHWERLQSQATANDLLPEFLQPNLLEKG